VKEEFGITTWDVETDKGTAQLFCAEPAGIVLGDGAPAAGIITDKDGCATSSRT
jgi:hypothetical protein